MDLKDMEASGVMDYYLDLSKFINIFINTNYPLTKEDVVALIEDRQTLNLKELKRSNFKYCHEKNFRN